MTCRGTTILAQDPGITIVGISLVGSTKTDLETDLVIDRVQPELGHRVDKEGTTLTLGIIMRKRLETLLEGKTDMTTDMMTLAMVGINEGAARRPCFMGGPL